MKIGQPLAEAKPAAFEPEALPYHEMVLIPGGTFRMGSDRHYREFKDYPPSQRPSSFSIDQIIEKMQRSLEGAQSG